MVVRVVVCCVVGLELLWVKGKSWKSMVRLLVAVVRGEWRGYADAAAFSMFLGERKTQLNEERSKTASRMLEQGLFIPRWQPWYARISMRSGRVV